MNLVGQSHSGEKNQEKPRTGLPKPASWQPLNERNESMPELEGSNMNESQGTDWVHPVYRTNF